MYFVSFFGFFLPPTYYLVVMEICLTVLNGESSKSNGKSFINSSTLMLVRKFLLMAGNRLELNPWWKCVFLVQSDIQSVFPMV